ncbi:MAG: VanW family protein [Ancrocorticia sp.]|jgi:vancomycin resistance protein YoaR|nr:VanW family protein [Ancrocorticia sp.]
MRLTEETLDAIQEAQIAEHRAAKKRRRKWPWITVAVIAVLGLAYVGAANYLGDRVPSGTKVASVNIGGLTRTAAIKRLDTELAPAAAKPISVVVGKSDQSQAIDPTTFSLALDSRATVNKVVGFSWNPVRLWQHLFGGSRIDPVLTVNKDALSQAVSSLATATNVAPQDASIAFTVPDGDGAPSVTVTPAVVGTELDQTAAVQVLSTEALTATQPIELAVTEKQPAITDEAAAETQKQAETLISDPLSVTVQGKVVELSPRDLASAATYSDKDGTLTLAIDGKKLGDIVRSGASDVLKAGTDARIEIVNHTTPTIVPSTNGVGIDDDALAKQVAEKGITTDRTVELDTVDVPASFTTEDAQKMGIKEVVSSIDTPLTSDNVRTTNLIVGTKMIQNTLVKPGDTFSLLNALGPITAERGFVSSGVVVNGFDSTALGGGLSQLSTNTFNLGYLAGLVDVEHQAHSFYFSRYPMGREATLWEGQIDMKWKNNTPYGVVIDNWVADGYVHSQLWSTKYWDVKVSDSGKYNIVQPGTKNNPAADCEPMGAGGVGFTVTVTRTVSLNGQVNDDLSGSMTWRYDPVDAVTCNKS